MTPTTDSTTPPALQVRGVSKTYPDGTVANDRVDLTVTAGHIHAVMGENGAGKSTLMRVVHGLETPDAGDMVLHGRPYTPRDARQAIAAGVGMVHQHFRLVDELTVAENVTLGREPRRGPFVDRDAARRRVATLAADLGTDIDPDRPVGELSVGQKQRVEILRVLGQGARLIVLDEPSAVLTPQEVDGLFAALRRLADEGRTVVFITHKLREVLDHADAVTVMRDGRTVGSRAVADVDEAALARLMVGRDVVLTGTRTPHTPGEEVLAVEGVTVSHDGRTLLDHVTLSVHAGEVVGIAGVDGNGQDELVDVVTGLRTPTAGRTRIGGIDLPNDPAVVRRLGVGHIAADRTDRGTAAASSIADNLVVSRLGDVARHGVLDRRAVRQHAEDAIAAHDIRGGTPDTPVASLSGGNAQKVVIARELHGDPRLLVAAQPTRGVDIGAIERIHDELRRRRDDGAAILLVSTELSELRSLADRLVVLQGGRVTARYDDPDTVDDETLGRAMAGEASA